VPRPARLAAGAAAGALAIASIPALSVALAGLALLALALVARSLRPGRWVATLAPIAVGVVLLGFRGAASGPPPVPGAAPTGDGPWIAGVRTVGAPRAGTRPATIVLDTDPPVVVAATLPWFPSVVPSDRVEVQGRIRPPPEDEYGDYLRRIGAVGTLRVETLDLLPVDGSIPATLEGLRRTAAGGLDRSMPEPEAGLAAGVLIGLRDRVDRDLAAAFTTAGASHVVAISGWNIAIVASTLAAIGGGLHRRRRAVLTAVAIVVYVLFVGPSPSVVRAGAMAGVALLAHELGRPGTAAAALGWAVAGLLLVDPAWIDDAGFRLSVLATAGIIAWGRTLTERLAGPGSGRLRRWLAEILGVSFAAQAATTPIVLLEFGRLSLVAPAVNLVVVPLVPPAMAAGALALVVGVLAGFGAPAALAVLVGLPAWALYAVMVAVVRAGAGLPLASLELATPWDTVSAVLSLILILATARWGDRWLAAARETLRPAGSGTPRARPRQRQRNGVARSRANRVVALGLVSATVALALVLAHRPAGIARVVVLDVGQGDGILVEGGRGGRMVVDGGPDPGRLLVALDERLPPWDRRIDVLVLTHPHEDHVAGLALLLRRYTVGRVYEPGMIGAGPGYREWSQILGAGATLHGRLATGDRLAVDGIRLTVLWPDPLRVPRRPPDGGTSVNNVSIVLLGEVDGYRFLLAGDVEEGVDPELVARGLPGVDLLKVAHHGSRTATTDAFLRAVRPRVAVVSAGAGNSYGHPAPATLERLSAHAGRTYRTDTDGTVEVAFDGGQLRVRTSGPRPVRPRATPGAAIASAMGATGRAWQLLCGISPPTAGAVTKASLPVAPEAPSPPGAELGREAFPAGQPNEPGNLERPANDGAVRTLRYHRPDGRGPGPGDRRPAPDRSPGLLLGRRRVRPGGGAGDVPERPEPLPRRRAGALTARRRANRARPPPGRAPRAAGDGLAVRRRERGDPARCGRAGPQQRAPGPVPRGRRLRGAGKRPGRGPVQSESPAEGSP
jgi:competence protein ComEC